MQSDQYYLDIILSTKFLKQNTKDIYLKRIQTIQTQIWQYATIGDILQNPAIFESKFNEYAKNTKGRLGQELSHHTRESYVSAIMSFFNHSTEVKEKHANLYYQWTKLQERVAQPIRDQYLSNEPTERQKEAYIPYEDVIKARDSLPMGSLERLLLSIYTEIPPVRSDFYQTRILRKLPTDLDTNTNYVILNSTPMLILDKYKTAKTYGVNMIDIPPKLEKEIEASLKLIPRDYLFVSTKNHVPYDKENTFNRWANRCLKRIFDKKNISITMLRHIYISRRDLKLEEKSGLEQQQIAKIMGHSVEQQRKYLWHTWLKKVEIGKISS